MRRLPTSTAALVPSAAAAWGQSDLPKAPAFGNADVAAFVAAIEAAGGTLDGTAPRAATIMAQAGFTDPAVTRAITAHLVAQGRASVVGSALTVITDACPEG